MASEHFDVLIVGAGLSGMAAAHHPHKRCPSKTFVILESRARIGGTWDLFRYPGVRSDSDMFTMAYAFRPWRIPTSISDGHLIREYIADTASEEGIDKHTPAGASSSSGVAPQRSHSSQLWRRWPPM
jgi:monooxygenase